MKKFLFSSMIMLTSIITYGQVSFQVTDGSKYLFGNGTLDVYYLYTSNGTNGTYGQQATCAMWGCYITIVNRSTKTFIFNAEVTVDGGSGNCGGLQTYPLNGSIPPNRSMKLRVMPDFWFDLNGRIGKPGVQWTRSNFQ